jgi:cystathionine gamma-synthase
VRRAGYGHFTLLGHGTKEELDQLELSLKSGTKVMVLFCEIPSNPQCHTPDLHRIRDLADKFGFVVVCDDTIATAVNVDIVPYVDVIVSSLSKIVSGACNVMGGSLLINPNSKHYNMIHTCIRDQFEDLLFPEDAMTLAHNCKDFVNRVRRCNGTAERIASFIAAHPAVSYVNYPTMVSSRPQYERYRRQDGGYGYILSIVFDEPEFAVKFYDNLAVCKGPSVGTNFSLALAYSMVAHADELDWAEAHGVPKYIIRISIGLEEESDLRARIGRALGEAGKLERKSE